MKSKNIECLKDNKVTITLSENGVKETLIYGEHYKIEDNKVVIIESVILNKSVK